MFTVQLDKQHVPVIRNGKIVAHKTAHFGTIYIGFPYQQEFSMVFDTGSAHILVPSEACYSDACKSHRKYDYRKSSTAVPLNHDGSKSAHSDELRHDRLAVQFGAGNVEGPFVSDTVCLEAMATADGEDPVAPKSCVQSKLIHATSMSDSPFGQFKFDGVFGLGLPKLSISPDFNHFGQMIEHNEHVARPLVGFFMSRNDAVRSEISFGGYDENRISSELQYVPVVQAELGYWQIEVKGVRIAGGEPLPLCEDGTCLAIVDTGTSLLGVPKMAAEDFHTLLARMVTEETSDLDCRQWPGPQIMFELAGGVEVSLGSEDYSRPAPLLVQNETTGTSHEICRAALLPVRVGPPLGDKVFIFGEPMLKKYYTAYDFMGPNVGFSQAVQPKDSAESPQFTVSH